MPVDEDLLDAHRSFADRQLGIAERFVRLDLRSGWTVGVLSTPLLGSRPVGWVVCHSFGSEEMDLHTTDVAVARSLAGAGFPVLRFACQGYGDSEHIDAVPGLSTHLGDTEDAVLQMSRIGGVAAVGVLGARFGGTVAALVAERLALPHLVAIAPVVEGRRYVGELLRSQLMTEMVKGDGGTGRGTADELRTALSADGELQIKGYTLTGQIVDELRRVDLTRDLRGFGGSALVVQVSVGDRPQASLSRLVARLGELGAAAAFRIVHDRAAGLFGHEHFQEMERGRMQDRLAELTAGLSRAATEWAEDLFVPGTRQEGSPA